MTPYDDGQRFPAGDHVVQSKECMGLMRWTADDRSLVDADPVVWFSYGITHNPRIEVSERALTYMSSQEGWVTRDEAPMLNSPAFELSPVPDTKSYRR